MDFDVDNGHNGRMNAVAVRCQITDPTNLHSYPTGTFDAYIHSKDTRDYLEKNKDLPETSYQFWNSDKTSQVFVNNGQQATYRNARRMLAVNFGFQTAVSTDQLKAFLIATGLF